jgi:hypothetical protein
VNGDLTHFAGRLYRDERGTALTWFVLSLPVLILVAGFVVNFAKWFEDKRHLQTQVDAAALAGGLDFGSLFGSTCDDAPIAASALTYSGDTHRAPSPFNLQVSDAASVHVVLNGDDNSYWKTGDPDAPGPAYGNLGSPCSTQFLDVKATHDRPSSFLGTLVPSGVLPAIHAHARVTLETLTGQRALPVAVPQPTPLNARAYFVDETTKTVLGSVPLFDTGINNSVCGGECWTSYDAKTGTYNTVAVPTNAGADVSVRIALSTKLSNNQCGQALVTCYDDPAAPTTPPGLDHIRVFDQTADPTSSAPLTVYGAVLVPAAGSGCSNAYFLTAATCSVDLYLQAKFFSQPTAPITNLQGAVISARVGGNTYTMAKVPPASPNFANCPAATNGSTCWGPTGGQDIPLTQIGWNTIDAVWKDTVNSDRLAGNACTGSGCTGPAVTGVQRGFVADATVSGQVTLVDVLDGSDPNALAQHSYDASVATRQLGVEVGVATGFRPAQAANAPVVYLRVAGKQNSNGNASQNQSLNCDKSGTFLDALEFGCDTDYVTNTGTPCPGNAAALFATDPPYECVPTEQGDKTNQVGKAMNFRIEGDEKGALGCKNPNNWPTPATAPADWTPSDLPKQDPRKMQVFLTPYNTFQGSGNATFPVIGFATFYVTGWSGNGQSDDPCPRGNGPGQDTPIPGNDGGVLAGRFITDIARLQHGGSSTPGCNLTGINTCVVKLTQ